jgi:predicted RNA methylase
MTAGRSILQLAMRDFMPKSRFVDRLKGRSLSDLPSLAIHNIQYHARELMPKARRRNREFQDFDRKWGTDTFGIRELHTLDVDASVAMHARRYQASNGARMGEWFADLQINPRNSAFIDYGCGKGRALFEAAQFPFARVIGVEFAPELAEIALKNRDVILHKNGLKAPIEVICMDARQYEPPKDIDLVCFFYDPFGNAVMAPVVERLSSLHQSVKVIYLEPNCADHFRNAGVWIEGISAETVTFCNSAARTR